MMPGSLKPHAINDANVSTNCTAPTTAAPFGLVHSARPPVRDRAWAWCANVCVGGVRTG
jgi:hypothetical protein